MLYSYDLTLRLEYNFYDVRATVADSEIRMKLEKPFVWNIPISVVDSEKKWSFEDEINIMVYTVDDSDEGGSKSSLPARYFVAEVNGIPAKSEDDAFEAVESYINNICIELTLLTNKHNANRQCYQPRVYPAWNKAKWSQYSYTQYEAMIQAELNKEAEAESTDRVKVVKLCNRITISSSVYAFLTEYLNADDLHPERWVTQGDAKVDFVRTAIYSALGDEGVESKYFHLFTIIEFIERDKTICKLLDAKPVYSSDQITAMTNALLNVVKDFDSSKVTMNRLKSRIMSNLGSFTDLTRAEKLISILKMMKVATYERHEELVELTPKDAQNLIDLRNGLFHGVGTDDKREKQYWDGVEQLLYICEKILNYFLDEGESSALFGTFNDG